MGKLFKFVFWMATFLGIVAGIGWLLGVRWWQIPTDEPVLGASVTPSLNPGDWVLSIRQPPPRFGALVACTDPEDENRVVIGRLVGEQGDTVTINGARLQINDHDVPTETACGKATFHVSDPSSGSEVEQHCSLEAMGGVLHMRAEVDGLRYPVTTTRTVGEGKVFLVSDNRAFPYDSRIFGSVERSTCTESIFFRLVSKDGFDDAESRLTYVR